MVLRDASASKNYNVDSRLGTEQNHDFRIIVYRCGNDNMCPGHKSNIFAYLKNLFWMADPFTNEYIYLYNPLKGLFEAHGKQDFQAFAPSHLFLKRTLASLS